MQGWLLDCNPFRDSEPERIPDGRDLIVRFFPDFCFMPKNGRARGPEQFSVATLSIHDFSRGKPRLREGILYRTQVVPTVSLWGSLL